jgi:hypothetical protein
LDADWEQFAFVELDAEQVTLCVQQAVDYVVDKHVKRTSGFSDEEDGDGEVPIASHLEVM